MLSRGLKRTYFTLKSPNWALDLRICLFVKGLIELNGIFSRLYAVTKEKSPPMAIKDVLSEKGGVFFSADGKEQYDSERIEEDLKSHFKVDALQVHQKADVVFESHVITSRMDPFFVQLEMEPVEGVSSDQLRLIRDLFYRSVHDYYEGVVTTSFRKRSDIFKDIKSLWISSFYQSFDLMNGLLAESIFRKYLAIMGENATNIGSIIHSLGLALLNLSNEISFNTLRGAPHSQDLLAWICKEFRMGIQDEPKTKDLVVFMGVRNEPIYFGIVMDGAAGMIRHYLTRIKNSGVREVFFQAGDIDQLKQQNPLEISIGHHHALLVTASLGIFYHEDITQMVFLRKIDLKH